MIERKSESGQAASNGAKRPNTKERVAMAAGWAVADAIPDALYSRGGTALAQYWEVDVLRSDRFEQLEWFATDLGTLAEATAFPVETARNVVHAFVAELIRRECALPADALEIANCWFEAGRGSDAVRVMAEWKFQKFDDPKFKPSVRPMGNAQ